MSALMRRPNMLMTQTSFLATRGHFIYPNVRHRNLKYKSMARERRKEKRRGVMGGIPSPKESGEDIPPFFLPTRNKLFF